MNKYIKNKLQVTIIIFLSVLVFGCGSQRLPAYNIQQDDLTKKGVVVVKANDGATHIRFKKLDKDYKDPNAKLKNAYDLTGHIKGLIFSDQTYEKSFYSLEPGIYYISYATGQDYSFIYNTTLAGITPEGRIVYGAFEVKAGEVLYIGNIIFNWFSPKQLVEVSGDVDQTKTDLLHSDSQYKHLVAKMKRGKFYPLGTTIYVDNNGNFKID